MQILAQLLQLYAFILLARAVFSWFPVQRGGLAASINDLLIAVTEPVLAPVRRVIPPAGMFDLSFIVVFIAIQILASQLARA